MSPEALDPGGAVGAGLKLVPQYLLEMNKPPSGGHPTLIQEQKSSGRKKSLLQLQVWQPGALNLQGRSWAASQCLPITSTVLYAVPSHLTVRCGLLAPAPSSK